MRYLRIIKTLMVKSLTQEMTFRFNFGVKIAWSLLGLAGGLGGILILFSQQEVLRGWSLPEALALLGVYFLVQASKNLVIGPSLDTLGGLGGELWTGAFDYTLLKPAPTQFFVSIRNWSFWALFDFLTGLVLLGVSLVQLRPFLSPGAIILFILALLVSLTLIYAFLLIVNTIAFWYLGTPLSWIFDNMMQMGRFPVGIYPGFLKTVLTWIIPVGFMVTVPAEILVGRITGEHLMGGIVLAAGMFTLASWFFRVSVKRYASASS